MNHVHATTYLQTFLQKTKTIRRQGCHHHCLMPNHEEYLSTLDLGQSCWRQTRMSVCKDVFVLAHLNFRVFVSRTTVLCCCLNHNSSPFSYSLNRSRDFPSSISISTIANPIYLSKRVPHASFFSLRTGADGRTNG